METLLLTLDISHTFLYSVSIVNFEQVNVGWKEVQKTSWTSSDCFKTSCVQGVNSVLFRFWHQMLQDTEKSWNIWKHWLQHRFFPGKIAKFLRIYFFKDIFFSSLICSGSICPMSKFSGNFLRKRNSKYINHQIIFT